MKIRIILMTLLLAYGAKVLGQSKASSDSALTKLATKIVNLRLEVENLNTEFQTQKSELDQKYKTKGARVAQMEAQISSEQMKKKQVLEKIKVLKKELKSVTQTDTDLKPFLGQWLTQTLEHVEEGMPFKTQKRVKELTDIKDKLDAKVLTVESALSRLWATLEDELRLSRENALHRQMITLDGEERLATIAKLGMVMMYFHTSDNLVGYVQKDGQGQYVYVEEKRKNQKEHILTLVDGLKKQIRHGRYVLPVALTL